MTVFVARGNRRLAVGEHRVADGERMRALFVVHRSEAEHLLQLIRRHGERAGRLGLAGFRLRIGRRPRGLEGDVALHFLHDLVDVPVEHRDGAEALDIGESLRGIAGAPAPLRR